MLYHYLSSAAAGYHTLCKDELTDEQKKKLRFNLCEYPACLLIPEGCSVGELFEHTSCEHQGLKGKLND